MKFETCHLADVVICRPDVFPDARGFFREISRVNTYAEAGIDLKTVQVNTSCSRPGVLRGMHYQRRYVQSKLVTCVAGAVYDVIVDCRPGSPTFGQWFGIELTAAGGEELFVPKGFAHGFQVLGKDPATIVYQCDDYFHPGDEGGVHWASPALAIDWPVRNPILSDKDAHLPPFSPDLQFPEC